jgi:NADPH-dependent 2,4-dienoyl-CoA reductase/sulfur reductase-like enzyme/flavodoxin
MNEKHRAAVIVGGGQAGARAANAMRAAGFDGSIRIFGAEPHLPYERPLLSKALLKNPLTPIPFVFDSDFYASQDIEVETDCLVAAIDRDTKTIRLARGDQIPYDVLLLATGSRLRPLVIDGFPSERILSLRTLDDSRDIERRLAGQPAVAVVGGGFIGLEVAATMAERGCRVTVIELADRLLPRMGCPEASRMVLDHHRAAGLDIRLGTRVRNGGDGYLDLGDGSRIDAAFVIAGVGVVPNAQLAEAAGLDVDDGILVDEFARTSDPSIYAAGDVTRHYNPLFGRQVRLESWQNANLQAEAAGRAMAGAPSSYAEVPWLWSDQGTLNLQIAGAPVEVDRAILRGDPDSEGGISILQFHHGRLVGGLTLNRGKDMPLIRRMLASGVSEEDLNQVADESTVAPVCFCESDYMSDKVTILVATMSGTAEMVADELANRIEDSGRTAKIVRMEKASVPAISQGGLWIICSSTYGTGDVPDNGQALFTALDSERPDLSGVRYGVVALGDSVYPNTFCFGGKKFDALFESLGAKRLGERLDHDSRGGVYPEDAAAAWVETWLVALDA